jgi:hypothetical protein
MGVIVVPTDDTNTVPGFAAHVLAGTTITYTEVYAFTLSGSMTATLTQNGTPIPGLTNITIDATPTIFTPTNPVVVSDLDVLSFTPLTVSSADGASVNFFKTVEAT